MIALVRLALPLSVWLAVATPPPTLTLKDGRIFYLKAAPHDERGRMVFTTLEGKTYSLDPSEVRSFVNAPPTATRTPYVPNAQDSHALGAIARQKRQKDGKTSDLSGPRSTRTPARTPRARKAPSRTQTPKPTPTASGAAKAPTAAIPHT